MDGEVGQPVYFDTQENSFRKSQIDFVSVGNDIRLSDSSQAWGIVTYRAEGSDLCTILIDGIATIDLTESTTYASPTGLFYLTREAGLLSLTADEAVHAPVLAAMGDGRILFRPTWVTPQSLYRIRKFELEPGPAGSSIVVSGESEITDDGDPDQNGWLPVTSTVFDGMTIPDGAEFGYNIANEITLREAWPPVPLSLVSLRWQVEGTGRSGGGDVSPDLVQFNSDGIWWMSKCADQVPWSTTGAGSSCGDRVPAFMHLYFPANIPNATGRVTSLRSLSESLAIYRRGTTEAAIDGDLDLALSPNWVLSSVTNDTGAYGFKSLDNEGRVVRGPLTHGIKSNSESIVVAGTAIDADGFSHGRVTVTLGGPQNDELLPQRVALDGASTDESYGISLAIGLPPGQTSSIRTQFYVPGEKSDSFYLLQFEYWLSAAEAGVLPELGLTARAWLPPGVGTVGTAPTSDAVLTAPVYSQSVPVDGYVKVVSEAFSMRAGSVLSVQLTRNIALGDRSSIQARVLKQLLRIIRPADLEDDSVDPDSDPSSGIYDTSYANEYA